MKVFIIILFFNTGELKNQLCSVQPYYYTNEEEANNSIKSLKKVHKDRYYYEVHQVNPYN